MYISVNDKRKNKNIMGKYKGYKNGLEKFFSSDEGQRVLNFAYGFGASIVIVGALFKLIHLPGADIMLCVGMGAEALIFALSAFDKPASNYHWERIFPGLHDENMKSGDLSQIMNNMSNNYAASANNSNMTQGQIQDTPNYSTNERNNTIDFSAQSASPEYINQTVMPGASINNPRLEKATEMYVEQINSMVEQMSKLKDITSSLTNVSVDLLNSYSAITDNSGNLSSISGNYVAQLDALNKNITGLNTIYEIQLKSVSSQLDTIDKVNSGLSNIRNLYENSSLDSYKIRQETEKMTMNLSQLNQVYERMLTAMTMNMQNPNNIR